MREGRRTTAEQYGAHAVRRTSVVPTKEGKSSSLGSLAAVAVDSGYYCEVEEQGRAWPGSGDLITTPMGLE